MPDSAPTAETSSPETSHPDSGRGRVSICGVIARRIHRLAVVAEPLCGGWRWLFSSIALGTVPVLAAYSVGSHWHQMISATLLALLVFPSVWQDRWFRGLATVVTTFAVHSAVAIAVTAFDPAGSAPIFPQGPEYWQKQDSWIRTGVDVEYNLVQWLPAHISLLMGTTLLSFTSLGTLTFFHGFHEVDLMNYYNGQLILRSRNPAWALVLGWHIWSILRGMGYTVLSCELISLALQFFSRRQLATARRHSLRIALGIALLVADGIVKATCSEAIRIQLLENLT